MNNDKLSRRSFMRSSSLAAAGAIAGALAGKGCTWSGTSASKIDTSKVLNYNPKMGYRQLGKTGLVISEVSLGGHGSLGLDNRVEVLERSPMSVSFTVTHLAATVRNGTSDLLPGLKNSPKNMRKNFQSSDSSTR
ncbi:MAG: hypothetical protein ACYS91_18960 [Planctomycetota bacterium]